MKKLSIQLLVSASLFGLATAAQAQDGNAVKLPEPLAGAADIMKNAPAIAGEAAEKAGEMASDAVEAGEKAVEKAGEMAKDAMKAAGDAASDAAEKVEEMATETMEKAEEAVKLPEPLPGAADLANTAPSIAEDKPAMSEEKPEMAEEMKEEKPEMAEEKSGEAMTDMGYTIAAGDTLWDIAKSKLGDATRYQEIIDANPGIDPRDLKVGAGLKLPAE